MIRRFSFAGAKELLRTTWRAHSTMIIVVGLLSIAAGASNMHLGASLLGGSPSAAGGASSEPSLRTCSAVGTQFEYMNSAEQVTQTFSQTVSSVVLERENFLKNPSQWQCLSQPPTAMLQQLANTLPGWGFPIPGAPYPPLTFTPRPVSFLSFASVLGEYEREYECKLIEMQGNAMLMVTTGNDINDPCSLTDCPLISFGSVASRLRPYIERLTQERQRARTALERTLHTMRSFEVNFAAAIQLVCFERASLDLRNEMSLLADTTSCVPKIWDAVTSLHDRKL